MKGTSRMVMEVTGNKRRRSFTNTTQEVGDMLPESEWSEAKASRKQQQIMFIL